MPAKQQGLQTVSVKGQRVNIFSLQVSVSVSVLQLHHHSEKAAIDPTWVNRWAYSLLSFIYKTRPLLSKDSPRGKEPLRMCPYTENDVKELANAIMEGASPKSAEAEFRGPEPQGLSCVPEVQILGLSG